MSGTVEQRLATAISGAGRDAGLADPRVRGTEWRPAVVTAVGVDAVSVGVIVARRMESYVAPSVGDRIALARSGDGNWLALGRLAIQADTWQDYTPVFAAGGGGAIGNGSIVGRYLKAGRRVDFEIQCTFGSTTNYGTGSFNFSLPVTAASRATVGIAPCRLARSAGPAYPAVGQIGTSTVAFLAAAGATSAVSGTVPFTWTTGDVVRISGTYEAAA